jgi:hypothetical protein
MLNKTLLSTAAVVMTVVGAQAADLPSKKAAPATYVKICDAYGAGFFYIPGSETCIRLSGYARAEYTYSPGKNTINIADGTLQQAAAVQSQTGFYARGRLNVDARTPTSMGAARTFFRIRVTNTSGIYNAGTVDKAAQTFSDGSATALALDNALVQWAGFTFGRAPSNYGFMPADNFSAQPWAYYSTGLKQISYTATLGGGLSATVALEDRKDWTSEQTAFSQASTGANLVGNIRMDQTWGFAALHGAVGNNSVNKASVDGTLGQKTYGSHAIGATASIKLPMIAAGDQIWMTVNYTNGMLGALQQGGISAAGNPRLLGGVQRNDTALVQTNAVTGAASAANIYTYGSTTGWNAGAEYVHYWAPQWRSVFLGAYESLSPATSTKASTWGDGSIWQAAASLIYSPVKDFDIGLDVMYSRNNLSVQRPTAAFIAAGQPGLKNSNIMTRIQINRAF